MPIEYKAYGCKFKCGHQHSSSLKKILEHEGICWCNPKNKTCMTCKYEILEDDSCGHSEMSGCPTERWRYRDCKLLAYVKFKKNSNGDPIIPIEHCEYWEVKEGD